MPALGWCITDNGQARRRWLRDRVALPPVIGGTMPVSVSPNFEPKLPLVEQIEAARLDIAQLELTIAQLSAGHHEVADATKHLGHLRESLAFLLRIETQRTEGA